MKTKVFFRTDGSNKIGLGHIVRCVALAKMIDTDFDCYFLIQSPSACLQQLLSDEGQMLIHLPSSDQLKKEARFICDKHLTGKEIVVLDGYHFQTEYQNIIRHTGCCLICLDDMHQTHFVADGIINHSGGITKEMYSKEAYTKLFAGLAYCLLRQPFLKAALARPELPSRKNTLICLGGADPCNDTLKVLQRCEKLSEIQHCSVIVGGAYRHWHMLEAFAQKTSLTLTVYSDITAEKMADIMQKCGMAICSPSTVALEFLCVGGDLYLHPTADNQKDLYRFLLNSRLAFKAGDFPVRDQGLLAEARKNQRTVMDGQSSRRLKNIFFQLDNPRHTTLRKATIDDMMLYFHWANERETRRQSFNSAPIRLEDHLKWFQAKLHDSNSYLYVLSFKGIEIGQIRFEIGRQAVLNYAVDAAFRGRGFGKLLIEKGIQQLQKDAGPGIEVLGYVKQDNVASKKTFERLNFTASSNSLHSNSIQYLLRP